MSAGIAAGTSDARYAGLAAIMAAAFLSYAAFSLILRRFAYTRLGRYDGAVSYGVVAMVGVKALLAAIGVSVPAAAEWIFLGLSALFLAVSAVENIGGIRAAGRAGKKQNRPDAWRAFPSTPSSYGSSQRKSA
jgi:hypothetical protein